jgi:hypothetical protein
LTKLFLNYKKIIEIKEEDKKYEFKEANRSVIREG